MEAKAFRWTCTAWACGGRTCLSFFDFFTFILIFFPEIMLYFPFFRSFKYFNEKKMKKD